MKNTLIRKALSMIKKSLCPKAIEGEEAINIMIKLLQSERPVMLARFGSTEAQTIVWSMLPLPLSNILQNRTFNNITNASGFFPRNKKAIKNFCTLMKADMANLDALFSWRAEELFFQSKISKSAFRLELGILDSWVHKTPWTQVLKDKKVLVIHPFAKSIEKQYYTNREKLFVNPDVLPEFKSLQTIKAVQTIANNESGFNSWFEALEFMKRQIDKADFDIAIIGCGAYGFPLAAYCKSIGKKAVHMGGCTQLLFGIKGKRWENESFINEYFISPSEDETPSNKQSVENGCYW